MNGARAAFDRYFAAMPEAGEYTQGLHLYFVIYLRKEDRDNRREAYRKL
jgi:hypothetical protein